MYMHPVRNTAVGLCGGLAIEAAFALSSIQVTGLLGVGATFVVAGISAGVLGGLAEVLSKRIELAREDHRGPLTHPFFNKDELKEAFIWGFTFGAIGGLIGALAVLMAVAGIAPSPTGSSATISNGSDTSERMLNTYTPANPNVPALWFILQQG